MVGLWALIPSGRHRQQ